MRFVVLGAGAIGGVVGGRLAQHGHDVVLIARGANYEAIRDNGLRIESPDDAVTLRVPVVDHPSSVSWTHDDVLLLATKTQDTEIALDALASAPRTLPIFCAQNSVANERMAAERFADVYGVFVWCPADYLTPGHVQVWCAPRSGILHLGCFPSGSNALAENVAAALRASTFYAEAKPEIMRWKYRKLLSNLGNAVDALCGTAARGSGIAQRARARGSGVPAGRRHSGRRRRRGGCRASRARGPSSNDRRRRASRRIVVAEPRAPAGYDRNGLSQRRNRAIGAGARSAHAGERPPAVSVAAGCARTASAGQRESRQDSNRPGSSTESTAVARVRRPRRGRSASRAA